MVFLFETDQFEGTIVDSDEGKMHWVKVSELSNVNLVHDFAELIEVMLNDNLTEFQYVVKDDEWIVVKKCFEGEIFIFPTLQNPHKVLV